jgi:hypothetical protein
MTAHLPETTKLTRDQRHLMGAIYQPVLSGRLENIDQIAIQYERSANAATLNSRDLI